MKMPYSVNDTSVESMQKAPTFTIAGALASGHPDASAMGLPPSAASEAPSVDVTSDRVTSAVDDSGPPASSVGLALPDPVPDRDRPHAAARSAAKAASAALRNLSIPQS